jgi:hypothetical protein
MADLSGLFANFGLLSDLPAIGAAGGAARVFDGACLGAAGLEAAGFGAGDLDFFLLAMIYRGRGSRAAGRVKVINI